MKPIIIPAVNTKTTKILSEGTEYLYIYPDYLRRCSRGKLLRTKDDDILQEECTYDYDDFTPKSCVSLISLAYNDKADSWELTVFVQGDNVVTLVCPDHSFGKDLYKKLISWYLEK